LKKSKTAKKSQPAPQVFCNRTLNMKRINYIGVDMDHTLVRYKSENFEGLAHRIMREKLVKLKDYPKEILNLKFDFNSAIRGLVIDKAKGNLLKLSRHTAIRQSYHGLTPIAYNQQNKHYKSTYIDLKDTNYDKVDTTFSISFANLFAQLVDLKDNSPLHKLPSYAQIADDLNMVLDQAHRDGSLKDVVRERLSDFIIKDGELVRGIERYLKHDKKIFIVTNSEFAYAKLLLDYAINPYLSGGRTWQDVFSYVIVAAKKPSFFFTEEPFEKIDVHTGQTRAFNGKLVPGTYKGGNANLFTSHLHLQPDEILYIGDHIYGDIVRLKKDCAWRTALVVEELDAEIKSMKKSQVYVDQINALMTKKVPIESQIDELISKKIETGKETAEKKISTLIKKANEIDKKISPLIQKHTSMYNQYWGEVMRVGIEESYFAYQVERFACIYMARLSYLMNLSPRTYFRSHKRPFPHELGS
jgi:HAD superfamily 5'-nucleotidase-like hydrolase